MIPTRKPCSDSNSLLYATETVFSTVKTPQNKRATTLTYGVFRIIDLLALFDESILSEIIDMEICSDQKIMFTTNLNLLFIICARAHAHIHAKFSAFATVTFKATPPSTTAQQIP
jgi:hypothetical protein